jgi:hypothetical protein
MSQSEGLPARGWFLVPGCTARKCVRLAARLRVGCQLAVPRLSGVAWTQPGCASVTVARNARSGTRTPDDSAPVSLATIPFEPRTVRALICRCGWCTMMPPGPATAAPQWWRGCVLTAGSWTLPMPGVSPMRETQKMLRESRRCLRIRRRHSARSSSSPNR